MEELPDDAIAGERPAVAGIALISIPRNTLASCPSPSSESSSTMVDKCKPSSTATKETAKKAKYILVVSKVVSCLIAISETVM
jgi:hypothetical protein